MLHRRRVFLIPFLGAVLAVTQARAQAPGANVLQNVPAPSPNEPQREAEGRSEAAGAVVTPDALQGPPTPAVMYAAAGLNDRQLAQYLAAYRAHMAATWKARYAVMSSLRMLELAVRNSDADTEGYYQALTTQLWKRVRSQDEGFDLALGSLLGKAQLRRYRDWRAAWERGTRVQQHLDVALIKEGS